MLIKILSRSWKVVAVCVLLLALAWLLHSFLQENLANRSSEVQAISAIFQVIGSIAALSVALWISNRERRIAAIDKRQSALDIADSLEVFAAEIAQIIDGTKNEYMVNPRIYNSFHLGIVDGYANALKRLPLHELGSSIAVRSVLTLIIHAELFGQTTEAYIEGVHRAKIFNWDGVSDLPYDQRAELFNIRFTILCNNVSQQVSAIQEQTSVLRKELAAW